MKDLRDLKGLEMTCCASTGAMSRGVASSTSTPSRANCDASASPHLGR